ncbi:DUF6279 family lipoprotein [Bdellovibrio sp. ZAP7]|uniref:DUF6279 family lipoprotein n=1 Tax=Bdellovibrio sp. ZAP7 TaxID=2231053 RepID=UPI001158FDBB|nr:DUF6279 family lipoprotein [Bdellovibrio sp. ZAP7]
MKTKKWKLFAISILLICSGCGSSSPFMDAFLGGMSVTKVESYFNLDQKQEKDFEKNLQQDLARLKQEQMQKFATSIREIDQRIPTEKVNSEILSETFDVLEKEYDRSASYFKNSAWKMVSSLREEQFLYFEKRVRKEITESREQGLESKNEELLQRFRKQITYWVGPTSIHQNQAIQHFIANEPFPWKERIDNRESILNNFMAQRKDPVKLRTMTEKFLEDYDSLRTPEYAHAMQKYEGKLKGFLNKFWSTLSYDQKQAMQASLNKQALELDRMASTQTDEFK